MAGDLLVNGWSGLIGVRQVEMGALGVLAGFGMGIGVVAVRAGLMCRADWYRYSRSFCHHQGTKLVSQKRATSRLTRYHK